MSPTPDPLVRAALGAGQAAAGPHPDAEVLGLFAERALAGDERRHVETHVAACVRCQAIVAELAVTAPDDADAAGPAGASGLLEWFSGWRWVVPVASLAAAAIVAVWIGQPPPERASGAAPASLDSVLNAPTVSPGSALAPSLARQATAPAAPAVAESGQTAAKLEAESGAERRVAARPVTRADAPATSSNAAPAPGSSQAMRTTDSTIRAAERMSQAPAVTLADAVAPAAPAASAPAAAGASAEARAESASAPAASKRARPASSPAGRPFLAVAEVSPRLAWAVTAGAVFRTTDGDSWTEVGTPPGAPFSAVTATSADSAIVTGADGARHATTDGGRTWRRTP